MDMTSKQLREKTEKIGIHFEQSLSPMGGLGVGTRFVDGKGITWVIGRIDNVIYVGGEYHVNGYCVRADMTD